jgi:hypothetical protein
MTVKFAFVAFCFVLALGSFFVRRSRRDWLFLCAAMGFTVVSDYFLIINGREAWGVFIFCFAHAAYILRVGGAWRWVLPCAFFGALAFGYTGDTLLGLAVAYGLIFLLNLTFHVFYYREKKPNRKIMLTGLLLFALCDVHVLLFNLSRYIYAPELTEYGYAMIWVFYAPAQLLLGVSAMDGRKAITLLRRLKRKA